MADLSWLPTEAQEGFKRLPPDVQEKVKNLPPEARPEFIRQMLPEAVQHRAEAAYNGMAKVAKGERLTFQEIAETYGAIAYVATFIGAGGAAAIAAGSSVAIAAAAGVAGSIALLAALPIAVVGLVLWLAPTAKGGPGVCGDPNRVPKGPDDPRWTHLDTRGWPVPNDPFEKWMYSLLQVDWELTNNCRQGPFVNNPENFLAAVAMWNENHIGPAVNLVLLPRDPACSRFGDRPAHCDTHRYRDPIQGYMHLHKIQSVSYNTGALKSSPQLVSMLPAQSGITAPAKSGIGIGTGIALTGVAATAAVGIYAFVNKISIGQAIKNLASMATRPFKQ